MLRWMAPFLSFTAEEAWQNFAHDSGHQDTIFTSEYQVILTTSNAQELVSKWSQIRNMRQDVTKAIEIEREAGQVGSSLQAEILIKAPPEQATILKTLGNELKFVLITSQAEVQAESVGQPLQVFVKSSGFLKCSRCWHYTVDVGSLSQHPELCLRCDTNLHGGGEVRHYA
jgi:isoleucyl-tRNA synthetase